MSRTLLYTVQRVLEKLDLDAVNSINDTQDSILVAREAEDTLMDLISRNDWPETIDVSQLESVGDSNNPTALRLPTRAIKLGSLRYNVTTADDTDEVIRPLVYMDQESFLEMVYSRNTADTNVDIASYKGIDIYVLNDQMPNYYTTFDNEYIILDSYHSDTESTVQGNKTIAILSVTPTFTMLDDFVIPVDIKMYPLYLAELTSACSQALNGTADPENERRRNRGISRLRMESYRTEIADSKNKFGRLGTGRS